MPSNKVATHNFAITIDGSPASAEFMRDLTEVVVDTNLHLPDMCTIGLHDDALTWVDSAMLGVGKPLEVKGDAADQGGRSGQAKTLFKGEITALEPTFGPDGRSILLVRGYVRAHRLHRGKQTRTFLQVTDSDLASKIAGEVGLSAEIDSTSVTHEYVLQNNQTNMEFLLSRAHRIGYQVYVESNKLYFKKGDANHQGQGPELKWKETLLSFQPRLTAVHQADQIIVRGWDNKAKQAIVSQVAPSKTDNQGGVTQTGGAMSKSAFGGSSKAIVVNRPVNTTDEAQALADAVCDQVTRDFVQAEGICLGDPRIRAGQTISIKGVGTRFSGTYFVTAAKHVYREGTYEVHFSISGRRPDTLTQLIAQDDAGISGLVNGVVIGLVTNNKDPENLGRVKVKFPWLDENVESTWARLSAPSAGTERGFYYLPEVNDEVLLAFEHGDVHRPYIVGALWNSKDKPPKPNSDVVGGDGKVNKRIIRSRTGHVVILDDTSGAEQIIIRDKTEKNEIVINSAKNSLLIHIEDAMTIEAKGLVTLQSLNNDMKIKCNNLTVEAQQNCNIKASANCTVEGTSGVTVKDGGGAQVKWSGPTVNVNNGALEVT